MTVGGAAGGVRCGVCVVRAEADRPAGLRITVTTRPDVHDRAGEVAATVRSIDDAVARVRGFLEAFDDG